MSKAVGGGGAGAAEEDEGEVALERIVWSSLLPDCVLGAGAFGVVFRANWLRGKARKQSVQVAIKIFKVAIKGKLVSYASIEENLLDEARMMQRASDGEVNDFVVKLFGVSSGLVTPEWISALGIHGPTVLVQQEEGEAGGGGGATASSSSRMLALIMKYEAGGTLEGLLYNPSLSWTANTQERLRVLLEVATGLWHLHNNSEHIIIHGDIKPENVLLSVDMHVRLSDFGLATAREVISRASSLSSVVSSESTTASGTWNYQAPEMSRNKKKNEKAQKANRSTDIYAFGTLAWEILAGQKPWSDYDAVDRINELRDGDNLDMDAMRMDTPVSVRDMVASCLAFAREARPQIDEARICLEQAHNAFCMGEFDIFLSYAWGKDDWRKPLADQVYLGLCNAGYRVWMDSLEMRIHLQDSMTQGIDKSALVVVLLSPDYVQSGACGHEMREICRLDKPLAVCMVEPGFWRGWKKADGSTPVIAADSDFIGMAKLTTQMYADCSEAVGINWADTDALTSEQRRILTHGPKAMPLLKSLVQQILVGKGEGRSLTGAVLPPPPPSPLPTSPTSTAKGLSASESEVVAPAPPAVIVAADIETSEQALAALVSVSSAQATEILARITFLCASSADNKSSFGAKEGLIDALLALCQRHIGEDERVVDAACRTITIMAMDDTNRARFGKAGACSLVLAVLRAYASSSAVADAACRATTLLILLNNENAHTLLKGHALELVEAISSNESLRTVTRSEAKDTLERLRNAAEKVSLAAAAEALAKEEEEKEEKVVASPSQAEEDILTGFVSLSILNDLDLMALLDVGAEALVTTIASNSSLSEEARSEAKLLVVAPTDDLVSSSLTEASSSAQAEAEGVGQLIYDAADAGDVATLTALCMQWSGNSAALNWRNERGTTAMYIASLCGYTECLEVLLASRADPSIRKNDGCTPCWAATKMGEVACLDLLLSVPGIDVNVQTNDGRTCVFTACFEGRDKCLQRLIQAGADARIPNNEGLTPFALAHDLNTSILPLKASRLLCQEVLFSNGIFE